MALRGPDPWLARIGSKVEEGCATGGCGSCHELVIFQEGEMQRKKVVEQFLSYLRLLKLLLKEDADD